MRNAVRIQGCFGHQRLFRQARKKRIVGHYRTFLNKLAILRANAAVKINDPILLDQFKAIAENIQRQAEAVRPASQPGAVAPPTAS